MNCSQVISNIISQNKNPGPVFFEHPNCQGDLFPPVLSNTFNITYGPSTIYPSFDKIQSVWVPSNSKVTMTKDAWSIEIQPQIIEDTSSSLLWAKKQWSTNDPTNTVVPPLIDWSDIDTYRFSQHQTEENESNSYNYDIAIIASATIIIICILMFIIFK